MSFLEELKRLTKKGWEIISGGEILVDVRFYSSRILNVRDKKSGHIYYIREMDGNIYDIIDLDDETQNFRRTVDYEMSPTGVEKLLTISTAHISADTAGKLDTPDIGAAAYKKAGYGWFVAVPEDIQAIDIPEDLKLCLEYARTTGCKWLCFDRDGETVPRLKVYDW